MSPELNSELQGGIKAEGAGGEDSGRESRTLKELWLEAWVSKGPRAAAWAAPAHAPIRHGRWPMAARQHGTVEELGGKSSAGFRPHENRNMPS
jgi:hypothetical protein